jgi:hypothetical protein
MIRRLLVTAAAVGAIAGIGAVVAPSATAGLPHATCKAAAKDGRYNIPQNDTTYSPKLDRDGDGIACES